MPTNLHIDEKLLAKAVRVGGRRTKRETVNEALLEYVRRREQARILEVFGKVDYDPGYDYKAERRRAGRTRK